MTPEDVRARIAYLTSYAQTDPEVWHGFVDELHKLVLQAIQAGHEEAAELAAAALEADAIPVAWSACA
jgi:maltooligosyltrehalose synthase